MKKEIKIPDIAENVTSGTVANILVKEGETVDADQPVIEIETDKATTEVPSPFKGTIAEIKIKPGEEVKINQTIITVEVEEYEDASHTEEEQAAEEPEENADSEKTEDTSKKSGDESSEKDQHEVPASPLARKVAREHQVAIHDVEGSGPEGRISRNDVEKHINTANETQKKEAPSQTVDAHNEPMNNIARATAEAMTTAWQNIPQVTQFDEADTTSLELFRQNSKASAERAGGKLTITALLLKISAFALQRFPQFNASVNMEKHQLIYKQKINIGVAVDTEDGLLVPVIRDANQKSLFQLSAELTEVAKKARDKKLSPDDMQGGTFTISNLGGIGGTGFTPIVYPPQVAILGISTGQHKPVYMDDEIKKRLITPLSVSYDHRAINGADGARFLRWICTVMEDPYQLLQ